MSDRTFPFVPKSTAELELGDLIAVPCKGAWGVLQVSGLNGVTPEVSLLAWGGTEQPSAADVYGLESLGQAETSMEIFHAAGVQVVATGPPAERAQPTGSDWDWTSPDAVADWRTAIRHAQKLATLHGPRVPPVEVFHGHHASPGWVVHVKRNTPQADEQEYSRVGSAFSMLEVEQQIADHVSDHGQELTRSVFSFDQRELHFADGSWLNFWWALEASNFYCRDCGFDTIDEYYFLHDDIWDRATYPDGDRMFCIGCVEKRLGRQLTRADFRSRDVKESGQTARLIDRLTRD